MPMRMAERALLMLRKMGLVDDEYEFRRIDQVLIVPLTHELSPREISIIKKEIGAVETRLEDFSEGTKRSRNLEATLRGQIPDEMIAKLPRAFDVIGDIAIIELSEGMEQFSSVIGRGIIKITPHIRLVLRKSSAVAGMFRTRKFDVAAGVGGTETVHREFACSYRLDVSTVYFNPRLSHERMRVAQQVKPGELVVDMFAGVGPYSVLIAKQQLESRVYSVDINRAAVEYLKENAFTNRVADRVIPMLGDAKQLARKELRGLADRVIMNLPSEGQSYLPAASQILKEGAGIIHFYAFARRDRGTEEIRSSFQSSIEALNREVKSILFCKIIKEVAPARVQVAIDALVI